jgi:phosphatidylserine/phosphatidylglycerophosphate/cardiolipin synthase-like enzyme
MMTYLITDIQRLVAIAPLELTERICIAFEAANTWEQLQMAALPIIHSASVQELLTRIIDGANSQRRLPSEVAFALRTACAVETYRRQEPILELVWSGPTFQPYRGRRTDEVLLELIERAKFRLTLVSFALYHIDRLSRALTEAVHRGVSIRMFMEVDKVNPPDLQFLYGDFLATSMHFYVWSKAQRLKTNQGGQGILHAKAVIADSHQLLVSSANLTEYAMSLNIELGLVVKGGELPGRVERIFDDYVVRGVFVKHI